MFAAEDISIEISYATFGGGCFWCMEAPFYELDGVIAVYPGYSGGTLKNPTYKDVSSGLTGHIEVVQIHFDAQKVDYNSLLDVFWEQIDPTDAKGQFADRGSQYTTVIFYHNDHQKQLAEKSKQFLSDSKKFEDPIVTPILPATTFYVAEEYHHKYYEKNPQRYQSYKRFSGRDSFIKEHWKSNAD